MTINTIEACFRVDKYIEDHRYKDSWLSIVKQLYLSRSEDLDVYITISNPNAKWNSTDPRINSKDLPNLDNFINSICRAFHMDR